MLKKYTYAFLLLILFFPAKANIKDSVKYYLNNSSPVLIGGLSARNTIIGSHYSNIVGLSAGLDYGDKLLASVGIYKLANPLKERQIINAYTPLQYEVDEVSKFWYLGLNASYTFYKEKRWTLKIPLRLGFGSATIEHLDPLNNLRSLEKKRSFIAPLESGISAQYKLAWWIGLGGGLGSRIVLGKSTSQKFSGTYYNLGIDIYFGSIYDHVIKDMKNHPVRKPNNAFYPE